jgi:glutathione synthase/RimK-type ligase-like ATP-grasp enzyme
MRVAFVTTSDLDAIHDDVDLPLQIVAFANAGIDLVQAAWEDETIAWDSFDLVVVRSPWNYVKKLNAFRKWLGDRRGLTTFHNPVELIEWNIDKRYLADLAHQGVPIVPTAFVDSIEEFHSAAQSFGSAEIVVKPSVSAGSRLTGRYLKTDRAAECWRVKSWPKV